MDLTIINTIRTNNFNDEQVMQKIMDMWKGASAKLSQHEGNIYGLYYEYESDYKSDYTLSVAIEGESESSITIPENTKYEVFKVDTDSEQGILDTWNEIWNKEKEGQLDRAYTYDFEKYYPNGNIVIYIAVN
ncbi:AraC family transcriptional regulator [Virgibacillus dakarensis]|uniref:AraC family transcriptional regulator n=1 Tax=Lentibacillus populi TaxID=1827502 RepID=A0A9W5X5D0_9BACI|nr:MULTISPECIES: effector binding domain-containing protein [Bacillaceae]MBT2218261.1 effector binding domain-containing protein [Virgibacillus dakarensis]MTW84460.1 AraC family transcriptional regulator [Virgibacillus dakarensis]GGB42736.1 AraC family transcriptional regulator [Lentibacillus populi]